MHQPWCLRLKLLSGLDISEKRLPQDGRFSLRVKGRNIDVRLSTMPIEAGESVVMRMLDQTDGATDLDEVGMPENMLEVFRKLIQRPHGLILVTGPTGSGKTTTLYGALQELNEVGKKIITVEDPVEYRLHRVNQVQVNPKIDLSFARILRSALRQDPDILLVGEIRDTDTAEIALRGGDDRAYGFINPAHQRCGFQRHATCRHGCGRFLSCNGATRCCRATISAQALRTVF